MQRFRDVSVDELKELQSQFLRERQDGGKVFGTAEEKESMYYGRPHFRMHRSHWRMGLKFFSSKRKKPIIRHSTSAEGKVLV